MSTISGSLNFEEQEEAVGRYFEYLTADNPLRFGVSGEVMEEFIELAKESTKKALWNTRRLRTFLII